VGKTRHYNNMLYIMGKSIIFNTKFAECNSVCSEEIWFYILLIRNSGADSTAVSILISLLEMIRCIIRIQIIGIPTNYCVI